MATGPARPYVQGLPTAFQCAKPSVVFLGLPVSGVHSRRITSFQRDRQHPSVLGGVIYSRKRQNAAVGRGRGGACSLLAVRPLHLRLSEAGERFIACVELLF